MLIFAVIFEAIVHDTKFIVFAWFVLVFRRHFYFNVNYGLIIDMVLNKLLVEIPDPDEFRGVILDSVLSIREIQIQSWDCVFNDA